MDGIYVKLDDLPSMILDSKYVGGNDKNHHRVFLLDDNLIKINKYLYYAAIDQKVSTLRKELLYQALHAPSLYIETKLLVNKQKNVLLSSFPKGIFYVNNIPSGIILKYHRDYHSLQNYLINDYKEFLIILREILIRIKELDDNDVYQRDLILSNILYQKSHVELIDLDGPFINIGRNIEIRKAMYFKYLNNIMILLHSRTKMFDSVIKYVSEFMSNNDPSYESCAKLLDGMEEFKCNYRI